MTTDRVGFISAYFVVPSTLFGKKRKNVTFDGKRPSIVICITRLENAILQVQARFVAEAPAEAHKCEHLQNIF
jgi:hypothetical protein